MENMNPANAQARTNPANAAGRPGQPPVRSTDRRLIQAARNVVPALINIPVRALIKNQTELLAAVNINHVPAIPAMSGAAAPA